VCPNVTLNALNGTACYNGDILLDQPTTIAFNCSYENFPSTTKYMWYTNDIELTGYTSYSADIAIPSGTTDVKCRAVIDDLDACDCDDSQTITVYVVGK